MRKNGARRFERPEVTSKTLTQRPDVYTTSHVHSKVLCSAFAEGCKGRIVPPLRLLEGPAVIYGILRGCGEIIKQCEWVKRDFYHIDHGYFLRGHYEGYYRITRNALQCSGGRSTPKRWEALKLSLRPWNRDGKHIVICPISTMLGDFLGIDAKQWTAAVVAEVSRHTDRPVIVKHKDGKPLVFDDAWCMVTHSSNAAVDAVVAGVPVVTLGNSACGPVSWTWADIENPFWPDREPWAWNLADNQFTIEEMKSGEAWNAVAR